MKFVSKYLRCAVMNLCCYSICLTVVFALTTAGCSTPPPTDTPPPPIANFPKGIAYLLKGGKLADETTGILQNENVEWIVIRAPWLVLEPLKGQYDFSLISENIRLAKQFGKKVRLNISGGYNSPDWLKLEVPTVNYTKPVQSDDDGKDVKVPVLWNAKYQTYYSQLITKVAETFKADIHSVALCGFDQACGFSLGPTEEAEPKWKEEGFTHDKYLNTIRWAVKLYADSFKSQTLLFYFGSTFDEPTIAQEAIQEAVISYGKGRIGLLNEGLNVKHEGINKGFFYDFGASGGFIGYQTLWSVSNDPQDVMGCVRRFDSDKEACLKAVFDKGIGGGALFFEIYQIDLLEQPTAVAYGYREINK